MEKRSHRNGPLALRGGPSIFSFSSSLLICQVRQRIYLELKSGLLKPEKMKAFFCYKVST